MEQHIAEQPAVVPGVPRRDRNVAQTGLEAGLKVWRILKMTAIGLQNFQKKNFTSNTIPLRGSSPRRNSCFVARIGCLNSSNSVSREVSRTNDGLPRRALKWKFYSKNNFCPNSVDLCVFGHHAGAALRRIPADSQQRQPTNLVKCC